MLTRFAFAFALFASPALFAQDGGDVCAIRPDLCDDSVTPEPEAPPPQVERAQPRKARSSARAQNVNHRKKNVPARKTVRRTKPRRQAQSGCRQKGASYNINDADLPICGSEAARAADQVLTDLNNQPQPVEDTRPVVRRTPASSISFDSYMQANARNPLLAHRGDRQRAFQESARPATYSLPNVDAGTGVREDAPAPTSESTAAAMAGAPGSH